jgi:hypothetical protein
MALAGISVRILDCSMQPPSPSLPDPLPDPLSPDDGRSLPTEGLDSQGLSLDQELIALEQALQELKTRHIQVQQDQQTYADLTHRRTEVQAALQQQATPTLQAELKQIETKLHELSYALESQLLSWASFQKPFWQILRFGGLGLVLGWGLAFWALQSPPTEPQQRPVPTEYRGKS